MSSVNSPDSASVMETSGNHSLRWLWLVLFVIVVDQVTKWLATAFLSYGQPVFLLPVFDLTLLHNTGAAFSFLANSGGWQRWFFALIAVGMTVYLTYWLYKTPSNQRLLCLSLALIIGGAVGNLIDRVYHGYVVDFISVHWANYYFPAFNMADSAITVGAVLMIWQLLTDKSEQGH